MRISVLFLFIILSIHFTYAQLEEKRIAYLSKDRKVVYGSNDAAFYRTIQEADEGFILREYYMPSGRVRLIAECLEYEPDIIYHGKVKLYYENGTLQKEGQYDDDYATGVFVEYYETGAVHQRKEYQSADKELILQYYTPDGQEQLLNGNGLISTVVESGETSNSEIKDYILVNSYRIKGSDTVYTVVEKPAEYPGGMKAMMRYLQSTVRYPADARRNGIQGSVFTSFDVDKKGRISDLTTAKGVSPDIDAEALRVIAAMPPWQPARVRGKAVKSRFVLPIKFKLATGSRR
jgi:TonB family protein